MWGERVFFDNNEIIHLMMRGCEKGENEMDNGKKKKGHRKHQLLGVFIPVLMLLVPLLAGEAEPQTSTSYRFVVTADSRDSSSFADTNGVGVNEVVLPKVMQSISTTLNPQPAFILFGGDFVTGKTSGSQVQIQLQEWKDIVDDYISLTNIYPVFGGHERNNLDSMYPSVWSAFSNPVGGGFDPKNYVNGGMQGGCTYFNEENYGHTVYYCDHENARFFVLNNDIVRKDCEIATQMCGTEPITDYEHEWGQGRGTDLDQVDWLKNNLGIKDLNFVVHHEPAFGTFRFLDEETRDDYIEVLGKNNVTMIFSGHEHQYTRRLVNVPLTNCPPQFDVAGNFLGFDSTCDFGGSFYEIKTGTSGAPIYDTPAECNGPCYPVEGRRNSVVGPLFVYHYAVVDVVDSNVSVNVYGVDEANPPNTILIDSFSTPEGDAPTLPIEPRMRTKEEMEDPVDRWRFWPGKEDGWRYFPGRGEPDGPNDPDLFWTTLNFDDSKWLIGPTGIGYGDGDDSTELFDMRDNYLSLYARKTFTVDDPNAIDSLTLKMDYDDSFVAYLNGTMVARDNIGATPPGYNDQANQSREAEVIDGGDYAEFNINTALLQTGTNVLAIQGHNVVINSSDFSLIPWLLEGGGDPAITSPTPGSTLTASPVPFQWSAGSGVAEYHLYVGTTSGGKDIYDQSQGTDTSVSVSVPLNGNPVYVRLWWRIGGTWSSTDYTYQTSAGGGDPAITSPTPGSTLTASPVPFQWSAGSGVAEYHLYVGTTSGGKDIYDQSQGTDTSVSVSVPLNGNPVYVRLWWRIGGTWSSTDYTYQTSAGGGDPAITSPTPGSTLTASPVPFQWSAGSGVAEYHLYVGTTSGGKDIYDQSQGTDTSVSVSVPLNGNPVYVRLWWRIGGTWSSTDYTYQTSAGGGDPAITSPTPGSTLTASPVPFQWSAGSGVAEYHLYVGTTSGGKDIYDQSQGTDTSVSVSVPLNGNPVYVRLWWRIGGTWSSTDYTYQTSAGGGDPAITSPTPGSTLTASPVPFQWSAGSGVAEYHLYVGTTSGGKDIYDQSQGTDTSVSVSVPLNGNPVYVRLWWRIGGTWSSTDYTYQTSAGGGIRRSPVRPLAPPSRPRRCPFNGVRAVAWPSIICMWAQLRGGKTFMISPKGRIPRSVSPSRSMEIRSMSDSGGVLGGRGPLLTIRTKRRPAAGIRRSPVRPLAPPSRPRRCPFNGVRAVAWPSIICMWAQLRGGKTFMISPKGRIPRSVSPSRSMEIRSMSDSGGALGGRGPLLTIRTKRRPAGEILRRTKTLTCPL